MGILKGRGHKVAQPSFFGSSVQALARNLETGARNADSKFDNELLKLILDGQLLTVDLTSSANNELRHNLDRRPRGFISLSGGRFNLIAADKTTITLYSFTAISDCLIWVF